MPRIVRFGGFEVDLIAGQLRKRGIRIGLPGQSFQVLAALLERAGQVATREELRRRLWHDAVFVDFENSLNTAVARLREALCDSAEHPRFIETLPRRGYRFIASISAEESAAAHSPALRARLLVLPFVNLTGDPRQEYFSDAMTDEIITALASLAPERLAVLARTTAMHYKGSRKDVDRIRGELNVDYIVEGGVQRRGDELGVNVQLVQASDQTHLFARKYDAALRDLFGLHDCIAQALVAHIPAAGDRSPSEAVQVARSPKKPTEDLSAYNEYIQARRMMDLAQVNPEALAADRLHLERAITLDPEFALAYDALAEFYWYLGYFGLVSPRKAFSAGIVHAVRALEIDNRRAETHALLGQFHKTIEYNWPEVRREMTRALELAPNSPLVMMRHAVSDLMPHGRLGEAVAELERALELDPLSALPRFWLGIMLVLARCYERGIEEGRKLLEIDARSAAAFFILALCYRYLKNFQEALAAQHRAVEFSGGSAAMLGWLGLTLAESGQTTEARQILQGLHDMTAKGYVPPFSFALIHLGLREVDLAFEWFDRAVDECDQLMMPIKSYGFFDPLRSDPRFTALLRKMNLES